MLRLFRSFSIVLPLLCFVSCSASLPQQEVFHVDGLKPHVLQTALRAKSNADKRGIANKAIIAVIDYSLPSSSKRLWIIDTANKKLLHRTYVAHGRNSGSHKVAKHSNQPGSYQTSIGLYRTGSTYKGKHGCSLELHGLERGYNHHAFKRRIVMHGSDYVSESYVKKTGRLGRSLGCPAVSNQEAPKLIEWLKEGALLVAYYPDPKWLAQSDFL